jgi:hypothetical protein
MSPAKYFSHFYDVGRRQIGFSPATIDAAIAQHARASLNGKSVILTAPDGSVVTGTFRFYHLSSVGRWVNRFNERARA